jgi:hypothetical protein
MKWSPFTSWPSWQLLLCFFFWCFWIECYHPINPTCCMRISTCWCNNWLPFYVFEPQPAFALRLKKDTQIVFVISYCKSFLSLMTHGSGEPAYTSPNKRPPHRVVPTDKHGSFNTLDGPVSVSISHLWYYYPSSHPFGPAALQGHASANVFSWGLVYITLLDQIPAFEVLVVFVYDGVAIPHLVDDALPKEVVLPLLVLSFCRPFIVYELLSRLGRVQPIMPNIKKLSRN